MRRFLINPAIPSSEKPRLTGSEARHAFRVLRLKPGDPLILTDGQGHEWLARITKISNDEAMLEILKESPPLEEPLLDLTMGLALVKADRFDIVVQKGTELGLKTLVPLYSSHGVVKPRSGQFEKRLIRWREIARQSLKQCRRAWPVDVRPLMNIENFLASASGADLKIMLHQEDVDSGGIKWRELIDRHEKPKNIYAMVGPEGGFTSSEVAEARAAGFEILGLGPRTMRSETAALALSSILGFLWGDLSNFH